MKTATKKVVTTDTIAIKSLHHTQRCRQYDEWIDGFPCHEASLCPGIGGWDVSSQDYSGIPTRRAFDSHQIIRPDHKNSCK